MKMPKQHPKRSKKVANMAPTWAQVGAMLGSKIVLGASKSGKKATPKTGQESSLKSIPSDYHNAAATRCGAESKWTPQWGLGGYLAKAK